MPIYDHVCDHCGHVFSVVRSYNDPPVEQCPSCGKRPRRLLTAPAIVFKGSGWYKTDSRSSSSASKDGEGAKAGESGAKGPDTKPPAKTEKKASGAGSAPSGEATS